MRVCGRACGSTRHWLPPGLVLRTGNAAAAGPFRAVGRSGAQRRPDLRRHAGRGRVGEFPSFGPLLSPDLASESGGRWSACRRRRRPTAGSLGVSASTTLRKDKGGVPPTISLAGGEGEVLSWRRLSFSGRLARLRVKSLDDLWPPPGRRDPPLVPGAPGVRRTRRCRCAPVVTDTSECSGGSRHPGPRAHLAPDQDLARDRFHRVHGVAPCRP